VTLAPAQLYASALRSPSGSELGAAPAEWFARHEDGRRRPLTRPLGRWLGPVDAGDRSLLSRVRGTALDVGCGPGRLVAELVRGGCQALGVDISGQAVRLARRAGAAVLRRSVFDPLPGEGQWDSVLLADGNVGIGGDPHHLLRRCREMVAPGGRVLVELDAPGTGLVCTRIRLERGRQVTSWFDWASLGADAVDGTAAQAGLGVADRWRHEDRWFAELAV
jgi:SAM-dependent methyltransferase